MHQGLRLPVGFGVQFKVLITSGRDVILQMIITFKALSDLRRSMVSEEPSHPPMRLAHPTHSSRKALPWIPSAKEFPLAESGKRAFPAVAPALRSIFPPEVKLVPSLLSSWESPTIWPCHLAWDQDGGCSRLGVADGGERPAPRSPVLRVFSLYSSLIFMF